MALNQNTELALINTTANAGTIVLPDASSSPGRVITFKDIVGTFNTSTLTLTTTGSDTFEDGSTTKILSESNGVIQLVASGTKWYILTGTQKNSVTVSTLQTLNISSVSISTNNLLVSSLNTIYQQSTLAYFNSNVFAGSRVYPQTVLNRTRFSPRNIQSLDAWFDGADPFGNGVAPPPGTRISTWVDKSPNKNDATQTNVTFRPTMGSSGISFNGTNNFLSITDPSIVVNTRFTIFIVEQRLSNKVYNMVLAGRNNSVNQNLHIGYNTNTSFYIGFYANDAGYGVSGYNAGSEPFRIWSLIYNGTQRIFYLNGASPGTSGNLINLQGWNGGNIGFFQTTNTYYQGIVSEIIFTNPSIDGFVRQQTEGYLAWKWGLQAQLPASHPYKNAPPQ